MRAFRSASSHLDASATTSRFILPRVAGALLVLVNCGGDTTPAKSADTPPPAASSEAPSGAAVTGDLYAAFDGGAIETPTSEPAAGGGDLGAACHKAAQEWEKRARPEIKACYREGKKKDPNLMGTARILVDVGFDGKVKPARLDGVSSLGDDVAKCMVDAVSKTSFPESGECKTRQLTIPIEFPTPPRAR